MLRRLIIVLCATLAIFPLFALATFAQSVMPPGAPKSWLPVWPFILGAVQWCVGLVIKKNGGAVNSFIGWVTLVLSFIGYSVVPSEAHAFGRGLLGMFAPLPNLVLVGLQTGLVTGIHSWILNSVVKPLANATTKSTSYLNA
jgi:hypothetical protein